MIPFGQNVGESIYIYISNGHNGIQWLYIYVEAKGTDFYIFPSRKLTNVTGWKTFAFLFGYSNGPFLGIPFVRVFGFFGCFLVKFYSLLETNSQFRP